MNIHDHALSSEHVREIKAVAQRLLKHSTETLISQQIDALEAQFSTNFTVSGGDWKFSGRDDLLKKVSSGDVKYDYIKTDVERIDVPNEQIAIVSGTRSVKAVIDGKDFASTFPFVAVHALEGGEWRVALWAVKESLGNSGLNHS
jgi:hypothetical protein